MSLFPTKRCTMNCGLCTNDERTRKQMMDECDECQTLNENDHLYIAIERLEAAMVSKMHKKADEGRSGWSIASPEHISTLLIESVSKGDPVDVANYCMMLVAMKSPIIISK